MAITSVARLGRATLLTLAAGVLAMGATGCSLLGEPERPGAGNRPTGAAGLDGNRSFATFEMRCEQRDQFRIGLAIDGGRFQTGLPCAVGCRHQLGSPRVQLHPDLQKQCCRISDRTSAGNA